MGYGYGMGMNCLLIIGRFNAQVHQLMKQQYRAAEAAQSATLNTLPLAQAQAAAKAVFGYETPQGVTDPTVGIHFEYADAFRYTQPVDTDFDGIPDYMPGVPYGFVAILSTDEFNEKLKPALGWPLGPFCQIFDIEIIPLNDDWDKANKYAEIYEHMTPASWKF